MRIILDEASFTSAIYCGNVNVILVPVGSAASNLIVPFNTSHALKAKGMPNPVPNLLVDFPGLWAFGIGVKGMPLP